MTRKHKQCRSRIETLSKALTDANKDRYNQLFRLAQLGDKKAQAKIDSFLGKIGIQPAGSEH